MNIAVVPEIQYSTETAATPIYTVISIILLFRIGFGI